jgi:DNA replication and repair protein RecF
VWVKAVRLRDFRSYEHVDVGLAPGITTFVGANGQGKTNLVEAVGYVSLLGSHRVATDAPLVRTGANQAIVGVDVVRDDGRVVTIEFEINPGRANRARINRAPAQRARDVIGILRVVQFAPEDLAIVKGEPTERRRFMDELLVQRTPRLAGTKSDYDRVLKQRNALLKSASVARRADAGEVERTLSAWDEQLVEHGSALVAARVALIKDLRAHFVEAYAHIAAGSGDPNTLVTLDYQSSVAPEQAEGLTRDQWSACLLEAIAIRRREELDRGVTLVGPQRDDLQIGLGGGPAKGYASHGESWSLALALRLAGLAVLREDGDDPVLILDDVFAELDVTRRERLAERIASGAQVLITAAVEGDVPGGLSGSRLQVSRGRIDG